MPLTAQERAAQYHQRQQGRIDALAAEVRAVKARLLGCARIVFELDASVANLKSVNERVWTMYKNARVRADSLERAAEEAQEVAAPPEHVDWDKLAGYSPEQLQAWVKIGRAMRNRAHANPVANAERWVDVNLSPTDG